MLNRILCITVAFLTIFGTDAYATTVDLHKVSYAKHISRHETVSTVTDAHTNDSVIDLMLHQGAAAHVSTENYKPAQFIKGITLSTQHPFNTPSFLQRKSGRSAITLFLFRKQTLYPFHGFW